MDDFSSNQKPSQVTGKKIKMKSNELKSIFDQTNRDCEKGCAVANISKTSLLKTTDIAQLTPLTSGLIETCVQLAPSLRLPITQLEAPDNDIVGAEPFDPWASPHQKPPAPVDAGGF